MLRRVFRNRRLPDRGRMRRGDSASRSTGWFVVPSAPFVTWSSEVKGGRDGFKLVLYVHAFGWRSFSGLFR